jgi:hypothetical protein
MAKLTFVAGHVTQKDGMPFKIVGQPPERCRLAFVGEKRSSNPRGNRATS